MANIFLTGHRGFIGSHLVDVLRQGGHQVTGCDLDLFSGCNWEPMVAVDRDLLKDVRDLTADDVKGHDCIMHLAAISNDPMGEMNADLTRSVNIDGSLHLARLAKDLGVPRFLFSGTCSIYGHSEALDLDETAAISPLSVYAESKVATERGLEDLHGDGFTTLSLRNSTAYGFSRMLRIDLVANNLLACAFSRGDIRIMSDGSPWRPLIHCRDIARAFVAFLEAPDEAFTHTTVNVGANEENFQVKDVATTVQSLLPEAEVIFTGEVGADPRTYRVNFDRLGTMLPDFKLAYSLRTGLEELLGRLEKHGFSREEFEGDRFVRVRRLQKRTDLLRA